MASKLGEAFVELMVKNLQYEQKMKAAEATAKGTTANIERGFNRVGTALAGMAATLGVATFMKSGIEMAMKSEERQEELASALAHTGDATEANIKSMNDYAASMAKSTLFTKGEVVSAMARGKALGVHTGQLKDAAKAAIGLASRYKLDLETAMTLVGRASQGNTQMLKRYGIVLDQTGTQSQKFAQLLKIGADSFHFAEDATRTTTGKMKMLEKSINGIKVSLGLSLLPFLRAFAAILQTIGDFLTGTGKGFTKWASGVLIAAGAILGIIKVVQMLTAAWKALAIAETAAKVAAGDWATIAKVLGAVAAVATALTISVGAADSAIDTMAENYKKQAQELMDSSDAITDQFNAQVAANQAATTMPEPPTDPYIEQAKAILEVYKNTKQAHDEENARMRDAVGFKAITDIYRGAATSGARERFAHQLKPAFMSYDAQFQGQNSAELKIDVRDWKEAVRIWQYQQANQEAQEKLLQDIAYALRGPGRTT